MLKVALQCGVEVPARGCLRLCGLQCGQLTGQEVRDAARALSLNGGACFATMTSMVDAPGTQCWLDPRVQVRPSSTHGVGLFAETAIAQDELVSLLGGTLATTAEMRRQIVRASRGLRGYVDTIAVDDDLHLLLPEATPNGRGNHSCDPNTWWSGQYTLLARRPILAGEELTNDYATSTDADDFVMDCHCRTAQCRTTVTGRDWQRSDLQNRYGSHWVPWILSRIQLPARPV